ncbi:hypothetical protein [Hyphobacterium sp.]|uniref:hypothetical protein n=1 Tax=Hyphobacterium sp. TaxID=2004662 RepID=UPI003BAA977A
MTRHLATFSLSATLALSCSTMAMADIMVSQNDGQWQVSAEGERLSEVLETIQAEAGFRLVGADRLVDNNPVTAELEGSIDDVLGRLLAGFDYALVYGETPETQNDLQRVVLLSGRAGSAPDESQRLSAERIPADITEEEGRRVSDLLQRQVQPLIDAESGEEATTPATTTASNETQSGNDEPPAGDDYELDPETQAALAEATQRAQQDLQALVNALRAAEQNSGNDN